MQAVTVKFFKQTNSKPPRVQASAICGKGPMLSIYAAGGGNYGAAAEKVAFDLIKSFGWVGTWVPGETVDGCTVYVCANSQMRSFTL